MVALSFGRYLHYKGDLVQEKKRVYICNTGHIMHCILYLYCREAERRAKVLLSSPPPLVGEVRASKLIPTAHSNHASQHTAAASSQHRKYQQLQKHRNKLIKNHQVSSQHLVLNGYYPRYCVRLYKRLEGVS